MTITEILDDLETDERGSATGIANFLLALIVGAAISWIVTTISEPLLEHAHNAESGAVGSQATVQIETFLTNQPVIFLLTAFISLVALSVFQRETVGA